MKNFSKVFYWATVVPCIALLIALAVKEDPGFILISGSYPYLKYLANDSIFFPSILYQPFTFRTTLVGLILFSIIIFFVLYFVLRLFGRILSLPKALHNRFAARRQTRSEEDYGKAQLFLVENKPRQAEGLFLRSVSYSVHPSLCLLGAAKAAHLQKNTSRRNKYLKEMDVVKDQKNYDLAQIQRGEFLLEIGEDEMAEKAIEHYAQESSNRNAILLLAKVYRQRGIFEKLYQLMPELQRAAQKLPDLKAQKNLYIDLLEFASQDGKAQEVKKVWNNIPKELRSDDDLIIKYADRLMICNDGESAEAILRQAIKKEIKPSLLLAYGHLYRGNIKQLLRQAQRFANERSDNAYAQFALGKIELRAKNLKAAEAAAEKAIRLEPTLAVAHKLYGTIKLEQGEKEAALLAFQRASEILMPETPDDIVKTEGELLLENPASEISLIELNKGISEGEFSETNDKK